jgi:hypothetical protein
MAADRRGLMNIPDDLMRTVVEFGTRSLRAIVSLQLINRHFRAVMRQPKMVSHVIAQFNHFHHGQALGELVSGLRRVSIPRPQALSPLTAMPGLRTLHMPGWSFDVDELKLLQKLSRLEDLDLSKAASLRKLEFLPTSLRRLNVSGTSIGELPDMPNLEALDVSNCGWWLAVPRSPNLRSLKMTGNCSEVLDFRHLHRLEELDISNCELTHLKVGLQLRALIAEHCLYLREIPDLPNLLELNVMFCERLMVLPQLPMLLKLKNYGTMTQPNRSMGQLRELDANTLTCNLPNCFDLMPLLESLEMSGCEFTNGDFLARLSYLTWLILEFDTPADLRFVSALTGLTRLHLSKNITDGDLVPLTTLSNLKTLAVTSDHLTNVGMFWISQISGLEHLSVGSNFYCNVSNLGVSYLRALVSLRHLKLGYCVVDLSVMSELSHLESLHVEGNVDPLNLGPLADLKRLTHLELGDCELQTLGGLNRIPSLDVLTITTCRLLACEDPLDLIPRQLTTLTFKLHSVTHVGKKWQESVQRFKTANPWMEIHT